MLSFLSRLFGGTGVGYKLPLGPADWTFLLFILGSFVDTFINKMQGEGLDWKVALVGAAGAAFWAGLRRLQLWIHSKDPAITPVSPEVNPEV